MNTTYKEQIQAIKVAREICRSAMKIIEPSKLDECLNDAASTIAAVKFQEQTKKKS